VKRKFIIISILSLALINFHSVYAESLDSIPILEDLINEAVKNNPRLKVFEETIEVFKEKPAQAKSFDNPRLKFSIANVPVDTFELDQEAMTQKQVSLMQKFPFPGKLQLKGDIAETALNIVREDYDEQKNILIMRVKLAYLNYLFLNKAIEITEENKKLLQEFVKIAETKYEVGKGVQQDVIKAQVELSRMTDRLISFEQKRLATIARLNMLLNRPAQLPFNITGQIKQTGFELTFENLKQIAVESRPVFLRMKHLIEQNRFAKSLAEKNYYPDFDIGISYGQRDDSPDQERSDFLTGFVTINLPLWYKTKESRKVEEARANIRKTVEQYNALKNDIYFQIREIMTEIEKYNKEIELFQTGLIPQSKLSLDSAIAGYKVNKVDFLTLVNNQITLYNYELDYYRALMDHEIKLAELETTIGRRLFN
jgi:outer membrane protein TolC